MAVASGVVDGSPLLAVAGIGHGVSLCDPATGSVVREYPHGWSRFVALGDTKRRVLLSGSRAKDAKRVWLLAEADTSGPVTVWDAATGEVLNTVDIYGRLSALTFGLAAGTVLAPLPGNLGEVLERLATDCVAVGDLDVGLGDGLEHLRQVGDPEAVEPQVSDPRLEVLLAAGKHPPCSPPHINRLRSHKPPELIRGQQAAGGYVPYQKAVARRGVVPFLIITTVALHVVHRAVPVTVEALIRVGLDDFGPSPVPQRCPAVRRAPQ